MSHPSTELNCDTVPLQLILYLRYSMRGRVTSLNNALVTHVNLLTTNDSIR